MGGLLYADWRFKKLKNRARSQITRCNANRCGEAALFCVLSEIDYDERSIIQEFVEDVALIEGHRFDVGIFVTVTSLDPLRAYSHDKLRIK